MSRPWMGYLAGAAFALSTVGAAAAYAQGAQQAQDQASADSHASQAQSDQASDRADRDRARADGQRERAEAQRERADAQRQRVEAQHERIERVITRHSDDTAEHLRTMLQLKPGQEAALQAYVTAIQPVHGHEQVIIMSDHGQAKTTTQKLADMEQRLAEQNAQAKARIDATRRFYDQLEPSQKKVFDELPLPGPMMIMPGVGPMRVMVNMEGLPHYMDHMPPLPPLPPAPPAPPAPPRLDE